LDFEVVHGHPNFNFNVEHYASKGMILVVFGLHSYVRMNQIVGSARSFKACHDPTEVEITAVRPFRRPSYGIPYPTQ
jgi:hypothetical protein